jgi:hypothetical protein
MAYDTADLEKKALAAIKKHNLVFIDDVLVFLPCSKPTFYEHKLNESDPIKNALHKNKVDRKIGLRDKMYNAENPTAWVALYKLIGTDEEVDRLNNSKQTHDVNLNGQLGIQSTRVIKPKVNDDDPAENL